MAVLTWDNVGERLFETGVDKGVLYIPNNGVYDTGYAWNGLTAVTESPSGAEATAQYADNIKYLNIVANEQWKGTISAYTYPDEFGLCDGTVEPVPGLFIGQQARQPFGFAYRSRIGNDVQAQDFGFKLHLIYNALASPSKKEYGTISDKVEPIEFSWDVSSTPVNLTGYRPTSSLTIDSTTMDAAKLNSLMDILYGNESTDGRLPWPDEVLSLLGI